MATKTAVIGLGNIGGGVAANLLAAGHHVTVVDLDTERVAALVAQGAIAGADPGDAATGADVVFTSLPGPSQVEAVGRSLLGSLPPGAIWVELSTNDVPTARRLGAACDAAGVRLLDAPVSGGPEGAAAGTLSIYVGGERDDVAAVQPLLEVIGEPTNVVHVGPRTAGIVAKIAQVTLCYTQTVALTEALTLGVKGGADGEVLLKLIQNSAGGSYVADVYGPELLAGTYDASFPLSHAAKDMRLAHELASTVSADLPLIADVATMYAQAEDAFGPNVGHVQAMQLLEQRNDLVFSEQTASEQTAGQQTAGGQTAPRQLGVNDD